MLIDIKHQKNRLIGWDLDVTVTAEAKETIANVQIVVNDFPQCDEAPPDGTRKWHRTLIQQGVYPGDNKVIVSVLDQDANQSAGEDQWD